MFRPQILAVLLTIVLTTACHKKNDNTLLSVVPNSQSNIKFTNKLPERKLFNILYYLYFYNGGGVAVGDVNGDGLADIYFTANTKGNNKLYINKGNFQFEDVTDKAGVRGSADWCSGATMVDVNADGKLDIMVSAISGKFGLKGHNELFINNGNGTFTEESQKYGLDFSGLSVQTAFFDYDHDGDLDCYLLNQSYFPHSNVVNVAKRNTYDSLAGDVLYRNDINKTGKYTVVTKDAGIYQSNLGYGLGLAVADLNKDGWDDIYIGNDFHENDYYYINQKNGTFLESGANHFKHYSRFSMGNDINDYNNDGEPDVVTVDMLPPDEKTVKTYGSDENLDIYNVKLMSNGYQHQYSRNCLQRNNGAGTSFSDVALITNVFATDWSWAPLFADFDNDGKKDLFISSGIVKRPVDLDYVRFVSDLSVNKGMDQTDKYDDQAINAMPDGSSHPFFFKNNNEYSFTDKSAEWGTGKMKGYFNGAAYADLDNDGDLDMVINSLNSESFVMKNNLSGKKSVCISFEGDSLNRFGIGAKLYLFAGNQMQYQQMNLTRGFQSSVEPRLHFGLDSINTVDSAIVVWPNQTYQVVKNVKAGSSLKLSYKNATGVFNYETVSKRPTIAYEPLTLSDWKHQENDFIDFNVQYLIPHQESTRGPKIAVADVNGDGLDDMYVGGGKNQPKAIFIQQPNGKFVATNTEIFKLDQPGEDVDAVFFDANGDKHPDLLVVTGGNEILKNGREGADRLYINDGKGKFTLNELAFSIQYESKSCVTAADIDKDGDTDFFIGNLANQGAYGEPTNSFLYLNKGNGTFDMATAATAFFQQLGMVTDAEFADVNNDGWPDLIVVGEWMPVKIFINNKGKFGTAIDLPASTGLWQSLYITDVNNDGKLDLLAGNWGHNSKLYAGKNGPLKLYVKDFDNNNSVEQIMCYTIDGKEYTFLAKDELERALPVLKKGYLKYDEVAGKTVQFMFDDLFKDYKELKAEVLGSSVFINQGNAKFERKDLPDALQLSPLFAFAPMGKPGEYIAGGNFYGVVPYEGRYDAQIPTVFSYNNEAKKIEVGVQLNKVTSEVRDMKWITGPAGKKVLVISSNNEGLQFLKMN
jgi:hypothetical protein